MWFIDLNNNFECDWLIEMSDNKLSLIELSNNKLTDNIVIIMVITTWQVNFFKSITIEEIVIFIINAENDSIKIEH